MYTWLARLGRLYQVEYAMEAINHAGTCLGILSSDVCAYVHESGRARVSDAFLVGYCSCSREEEYSQASG